MQCINRTNCLGRTNCLAWLMFALNMVLTSSPSFAGSSVFMSSGQNVPIPDDGSVSGGWVSSTITINNAPANAVVTGIDVHFEIVHSFSADLVVDLNADSQGNLGNYNLWNQEGGSADNPSGTDLGITTFNGLSVNRTWYLYANDVTAEDSGYIDEWWIEVYYETADAPFISDVDPNPVPGLAVPQPLHLYGSDFQPGCIVVLWDITFDDGPYEKPTNFINDGHITISANFTNNTATWTAQVENPDGATSNVHQFHVVAIAPGCNPGFVFDCNGNCAPIEWLGDGLCDAGQRYYEGKPIDFSCLEFAYDSDDCILDCNGNPAPSSWIGDQYCDDGTYPWAGVPIVLNCPQHDEDGGDCMPPDVMEDPAADQGGEVDTPDYNEEILDAIEATAARHFVIITHGYNTSEGDFSSIWQSLQCEIADVVANYQSDPADWFVGAYDWTEDSCLWLLPPCALHNAGTHGARLGKALAAKDPVFVHLIAHSAGSRLIANAGEKVNSETSAIIHKTFLDAYPGIASQFESHYGGNDDFTDQYFSVEGLPIATCLQIDTALWTQVELPSTFDVDVSELDPDYSIICGSSHSWPWMFYQRTIRHFIPSGCGPTSPSLSCQYEDDAPVGFGLTWEVLGREAWEAQTAMVPQGNGFILPELSLSPSDCGSEMIMVAPGSSGGGAFMLFVRFDALLTLENLKSGTGGNGTVSVTGVNATLATDANGEEAWVNFLLNVPQEINFVRFNSDFGPASSQGQLSVFFDGEQIAFIDEQYQPAGVVEQGLFLPRDTEPGQYVLSFRLDQFSAAPSSVVVTAVQTGFQTVVPLGDLDGDGAVGVADLLVVLGAWGPCPATPALCPGDIDQSGDVGVTDLIAVLNNFGAMFPEPP